MWDMNLYHYAIDAAFSLQGGMSAPGGNLQENTDNKIVPSPSLH